MQKIVLISRVSMKQRQKARARDLYISPWLKKNLQYATRLEPDKMFILSAKYGLVGLEDEIEPYNLTLNTLPAAEIRRWAARVLRQLHVETNLEEDQFVFLAGAKYRKYLLPHLKHYEIPFEGVPFGKQLQQLGE
jgi:hypothetical protein